MSFIELAYNCSMYFTTYFLTFEIVLTLMYLIHLLVDKRISLDHKTMVVKTLHESVVHKLKRGIVYMQIIPTRGINKFYFSLVIVFGFICAKINS